MQSRDSNGRFLPGRMDQEQGRDSNGHFLPGSMNQETRDKIARTRIEICRRAREFGTPPTHSKCSGPCGRYLEIEGNFYMQMKRLKGGDIIYRPASRCKDCARLRRREKYDERREIIIKQKKKQRERKNKRMTAKELEKRRRDAREAARIQRALKGTPIRGPWHRYRHEVEERPKMVPVEPFVEWFASLNGTTPSESQLGDKLARAVRRAMSGEVEKMHLDIVDEVGVVVGMPHLIYTLYPHI